MKPAPFSTVLAIFILVSCKSNQAAAEKSTDSDTVVVKKATAEMKHFDAATYDASKIESVSMDANHSTGRIHIMEDKVLIIQDTIK